MNRFQLLLEFYETKEPCTVQTEIGRDMEANEFRYHEK